MPMSLKTPPRTTFYLIDLALYPSLSRQMFTIDERPLYELLYLQTAYARYAQQGPLLISPSSASAHVAAARWMQQGAAIALHTHATFSDVAAHCRQLTHVERQAGPPALFRYADSRIYAGLVIGLSEGEAHSLLGPIIAMNGVANGEAWQLESPAPDTESPGKFKLTVDHEQALQSKREQMFCQKLTSDYGVTYSQAQQWLQQMKALPLTTEYARWEGCRILAEYGYPTPLSPRHMQQLRSYDGSWQALLAELKRRISEQAPLADTDGDFR